MRPVQQPIEVLASPVDPAHQAGREGCEELLERGNGQSIRPALFHARDNGTRHPRRIGEVLLARAATQPKRA